ncbi:chondroitin sulfate proteoglycan 4 [Protopterus annectens]|uniref:chondroitin sulfate proteoglycan 4 n=1 Tax=Protopterus annectens TaxID=7888 RepID=UPI001CFB272B|nr:chondroitin sulfate proteoglycan 4 [Protopterus annectens]
MSSLWLLIFFLGCSSGASFFGDSYVALKVQNVFSTARLHLQFLTSKHNGLLLLVGGETDYLMVELRSGDLQVQMHLGSEEVTLQSQNGLKLSDLQMHEIQIVWEGSTVTLVIDKLFNTFTNMAGNILEMNVHHGFYLGGLENLKVPYVEETISFFRGCITNAIFNNIDILSSLIPQPGYKTINAVQEGCSEEFGATENNPIRFVGPTSFVTFASWGKREEGIIEFRMKPSLNRAPLIYSSGTYSGFIYLDIIDGHVRGALDKGHGPVIVNNSAHVSDDNWHHIRAYIDAKLFEITVDDSVSRMYIPSYNGNVLDLNDKLFIGGMDDRHLSQLKKNTKNIIEIDEKFNSFFVGCISDLQINFEKKSLRDALITKEILITCETEETDTEYDYLYEPLDSLSTEVPAFPQILTASPVIQLCKSSPGQPSVFANFSRLLYLSPLIATEGKSAVWEPERIHLTVDLDSINIRSSQVQFKVIHDAMHGHLELDNQDNNNKKLFTLMDIMNGNVRYNHDGSEESVDQLIVEVSVHSKGNLPDCLKKGQNYMLPIQVNPVNDPPHVIFPSGNLISMMEHTSKRLGTDIILIVDNDSACDKLKLLLAPGSLNKYGYLENVDMPGKPMQEFSCNDLNAGKIHYVHRDGLMSQLMFYATDGELVSQVLTLQIQAIGPGLKILNNTGLLVSQGDVASVTISNLSAGTSRAQKYMDIIYNITEPLQHGEIQKQEKNGKWKVTTSFHQSDILKGYIRYISTDPGYYNEDITEEMKFDVQAGHEILANNVFLIKVKRSRIKLNNSPIIVGMQKEQTITDNELKAAFEGQLIGNDSFEFRIHTAPSKGYLTLSGKKLTEHSVFTQLDVKKKRVTYVSIAKNTERIRDHFQVQVALNNHYSPVYTCTVWIEVDPDVPILTNTGLSVLEGDHILITKKHLFVYSQNSDSFSYEITKAPQYGKLIVSTSPSMILPYSSSISYFTNEDILHEGLFYLHDDSETLEDNFSFSVIKEFEGSTDYMYDEAGPINIRGTVRISIKPKNDQIPVRVVDKVFNVVQNGRHLLTTDDICYSDLDSDFSEAQLIYNREGVPYGKIVAADDISHQLFWFTQQDLRKKRVLFIHSGADRGKFMLRVSDGLHRSSALIEVHASEPYITLNITGIIVKQGGEGRISSNVLNTETNLDVRDEDQIQYHIQVPPSQGDILVGDEQVSSFTHRDLLDNKVYYQHDGSGTYKDYFKFSVKINKEVEEGTFPIKIILEGYQQPLLIQHQEIISVFEGEPAGIKKEDLMVSQEDTPPSDIVYSLRDGPLYGYLVMLSANTDVSAPPGLDPVQTFTQEDINNGRVLYMHSRPNESSDEFTVEVSNGFQILEDVKVQIEIYPNTIQMEVENITLEEGGFTTLTKDIIRIPNVYTKSTNVEITILEKPKYGAIRHKEKPDQELLLFTWNEVEEGVILYTHDHSESLSDNFTLMANTSENDRQSLPAVLVVMVIPVNDEVPTVTINKGLKMWKRTTTEILPSLLHTEDVDTQPYGIVYFLNSPSNGKVTLQNNPDVPILQFTQADIDNSQVIYTHEGSLMGGFEFEVSDGINVSPGHFFSVIANEQEIIVEGQHNLTLYPGTHHQITRQHLNVTVVSREPKDPDQIIYFIVIPPKLGRVVLISHGDDIQDVFNFTHAQVEEGAVFYQHEMPNRPFWTTQDSFQFVVTTSPDLRSDTHVFEIVISFEADCLMCSTQLWKNRELSLLEGQIARIDLSHLDASNLLYLTKPKRSSRNIVFNVTKLPAAGTLSVGDRRITQKYPYFLQEDLQLGDLEYFHQNSEIFADNFAFKVWMKPTTVDLSSSVPKGNTRVISEVFKITIRSTHENAPHLVIANLSLQIVQGSSMVLTKDTLKAVDADSPPEEITYNIINGPSNSYLANVHSGTKQIKQFTQEDINKGRVVVTNNGNTSVDMFSFTLSDGIHHSEISYFTIEVLPFIVLSVPTRNIEILQSDKWISIGPDIMTIPISAGDEEKLYRITKYPSFGKLMMNQTIVETFTHKQIEQGYLIFNFTEFHSPVDSFTYCMLTRTANISKSVNITVKPLVKIQDNVVWPRGTTVLLDNQILDASELANRTKSIPTFRIIHQPQHGQLINVSDNSKQGLPINVFNHIDLKNGFIGVELLESEGDFFLQNDSLVFQLEARGLPPAIASLEFTTEPYNVLSFSNVTLIRRTGIQNGDTQNTEIPEENKISFSPSPKPVLTTFSSPPKPVVTTFSESPKPVVTTFSSPPKPVTTTLLTTLSSPPNPVTTTLLTTLSSPPKPVTTTLSAPRPAVTAFLPSSKLVVTTSKEVEITSTDMPGIEDNYVAQAGNNIYNIIIPVCILIVLLLIAVLVGAFFIKRNKTGKHNVQLTSSKSANGTVDKETFRQTESGQTVPLMTVKSPSSDTGRDSDELSQNINPTLKSNQYWV